MHDYGSSLSDSGNGDGIATVDGIIDRMDLDSDGRELYRRGITGLVQETAGYDLDRISINAQVLDHIIADIDVRLCAQVNEILHHKKFQQLEAAWRSLKYLVDSTDFRQNIRILLIVTSKDALLEDFEDCKDWQKSGLFKHVYREQYNTFGGQPFGLMVGNFYFDQRNPDVELLTEIARVSAVAKCPFVAGASPSMFRKKEKSFEPLLTLPELYEIFEQPFYTKWNTFRTLDDARYIGLVLPRILLREPYRIEDQDVPFFPFEEHVRVTDSRHFLWGNPAFALAGRMAESFASNGWYNAIVGPKAGGTVDNLASQAYDATGSYHRKISTETLISEEMDVDLCNFGFIPLVMRKGAGTAAFYDAPSVKKVPRFPDTEEGREDELRARLGMSLPYLMISCRIAHYLKVIWRENMGRIMNAEKMVSEITAWLRTYCRQGHMDEKLAARYPLKDIQITAEPVEGKPGMYKSEVHMIPHFRLKGVEVELSMIGQFDPPPS